MARAKKNIHLSESNWIVAVAKNLFYKEGGETAGSPWAGVPGTGEYHAELFDGANIKGQIVIDEDLNLWCRIHYLYFYEGSGYKHGIIKYDYPFQIICSPHNFEWTSGTGEEAWPEPKEEYIDHCYRLVPSRDFSVWQRNDDQPGWEGLYGQDLNTAVNYGLPNFTNLGGTQLGDGLGTLYSDSEQITIEQAQEGIKVNNSMNFYHIGNISEYTERTSDGVYIWFSGNGQYHVDNPVSPAPFRLLFTWDEVPFYYYPGAIYNNGWKSSNSAGHYDKVILNNRWDDVKCLESESVSPQDQSNVFKSGQWGKALKY